MCTENTKTHFLQCVAWIAFTEYLCTENREILPSLKGLAGQPEGRWFTVATIRERALSVIRAGAVAADHPGQIGQGFAGGHQPAMEGLKGGPIASLLMDSGQLFPRMAHDQGNRIALAWCKAQPTAHKLQHRGRNRGVRLPAILQLQHVIIQSFRPHQIGGTPILAGVG